MAAALLTTFVVAGCLAAGASARSGATVGSAYSSELRARVAVGQGRTLYALSSETSRHLRCKGRSCLHIWQPLTVRSRRAHLSRGPGLHGRLGLVSRGHGVLQVTLNGMPLYRYSGDRKPGQDHGQGIKSFGGVWHAVLATGRASTKAPGAKQPVRVPPVKLPEYTPPPPIVPPGTLG